MTWLRAHWVWLLVAVIAAVVAICLVRRFWGAKKSAANTTEPTGCRSCDWLRGLTNAGKSAANAPPATGG